MSSSTFGNYIKKHIRWLVVLLCLLSLMIFLLINTMMASLSTIASPTPAGVVAFNETAKIKEGRFGAVDGAVAPFFFKLNLK